MKTKKIKRKKESYIEKIQKEGKRDGGNNKGQFVLCRKSIYVSLKKSSNKLIGTAQKATVHLSMGNFCRAVL